jgi:hypothetical protein
VLLLSWFIFFLVDRLGNVFQSDFCTVTVLPSIQYETGWKVSVSVVFLLFWFMTTIAHGIFFLVDRLLISVDSGVALCTRYHVFPIIMQGVLDVLGLTTVLTGSIEPIQLFSGLTVIVGLSFPDP